MSEEIPRLGRVHKMPSCWEWLPDAIVASIADKCDVISLRELSVTSKSLNAQCSPRMGVLYDACIRVDQYFKAYENGGGYTFQPRRREDASLVEAAGSAAVGSLPNPFVRPGRTYWLDGACADDDFCFAYALVNRLFPPLHIDLKRGFITDSGAAALLSAVEQTLIRWQPGPGLQITLPNNNITNVEPFVELLKRDSRVTFIYINLTDNKLTASQANIDALKRLDGMWIDHGYLDIHDTPLAKALPSALP